MAHYTKITDEIKNRLMEDYEKVGPLKLSIEFGISERTVKRAAKKLKLKTDRSLIHTIYKLNNNYFSIPNIENSYIAGLILADGYIKKNKIVIKLNQKDKEYLETLKYKIAPNHPILSYCFQNRFCSILTINSKQMVLDLKNNYGITHENKKNVSFDFPDNLNIEYQLSFLCGFIDGDGCIHVSKNRPTLTIIGSLLCLEKIRTLLQREIKTRAVCIYQQNKIYVYKIHDKFVKILKQTILEYCPELIHIWMKRKWDKI